MEETIASETASGSNGGGKKNTIVIVIVGALICSVLSNLGLLLVISLIPLQWIYYKAGSRAAAVCGGISLVLMVGMRIAVYRFLPEQGAGLVLFDSAIPVSMTIALVFLNFRTWKQKEIPAWVRVALTYVIIALVMGIIGSLVFAVPETRLHMQKMLTETMSAFGIASVDTSLNNIVIDLTIACMPVVLSIVIVFNWYVATWFWRRRLIQWSASVALANFRVAEYMVWPLLVSLAGFIAGRMVAIPSFLNTFLIILVLGSVFLYFLQGLGIIAAFFEKRRNPGMRGIALPLVCVILFLVPGVNIFAMVAIPLMGVLEIWVRMRPVTQTNEVQ